MLGQFGEPLMPIRTSCSPATCHDRRTGLVLTHVHACRLPGDDPSAVRAADEGRRQREARATAHAKRFAAASKKQQVRGKRVCLPRLSASAAMGRPWHCAHSLRTPAATTPVCTQAHKDRAGASLL